jgi:hypothetical protein
MIIASVISGIAAIIAASLGVVNHQRIKEVHVLVNNQLDAVMTKLSAALKENEQLKGNDHEG